MTTAPSPVTAWTLPSAKSGWAAIAFISCAWVAKSSAIILSRIDSYGPPSLIAFSMPVSLSVTEVLVITEEPWGIREDAFARGVKVVDELDAESVLFEPTTVDSSVSSLGSLVKR